MSRSMPAIRSISGLRCSSEFPCCCCCCRSAMKNRFHVHDALKSGTTIALDAEERHHARVLRVREGEEVELFDAQGKNYLARFESPEAIHVLNETENREPGTENHLAISIIQLEKFEFV